MTLSWNGLAPCHSVHVRLEDGRVVRRHFDHVRSRCVNGDSSVPEKTPSSELPLELSHKRPPEEPVHAELPDVPLVVPRDAPPDIPHDVPRDVPHDITQPEMESPHTSEQNCTTSANLRRSGRNHRAREKLNL